MSAQQPELCFGVIEGGELGPGARRVAGFASGSRAIGAYLQHPFLELPFVRIGVATRAIQTLPVIGHRLRL